LTFLEIYLSQFCVACYAVLGDVIFSHPYYSFPFGLLFYKIKQNKIFCFGLWAEGLGVNAQSPKLLIVFLAYYRRYIYLLLTFLPEYAIIS